MTEMEPAPASAAEPVPGKSINWTLLAKRVWSFCVRCIKRVKLTRLFKEVLTFTTTSLLLLVIIAIIIAAYKSLNDEVVVVEPINMPKVLADRGYTPEVAAKRIIDEVVALTTGVKSLKSSRNLVTDWDATNIQLPAVGLNFNNFTNYLRMLFGIPYTKVSGEVTLTNQTYALRIRIHNSNSKSPKYSTVLANDVDRLLRNGAEEFVKGTDPYLLAYYYQYIDPVRARELITYCLQHDPEDDDIWAINLSGVLELNERRITEAEKFFHQALELDDKFTIAYSNLGVLYGIQGKLAKSNQVYDTAMRLGAELSYVYNGKVVIAIKNEDKDTALHYIDLAMQADKNNPRNYFVRSIYHHDLAKDTEAAIKDLKTALSLSPSFIPAHGLLSQYYNDQNQYEYALTHYVYLSKASTYLANLVKYDFKRTITRNTEQLVDGHRYAEAIASYEQYQPYFKDDDYYKRQLGDYYLSWAASLKKEADNSKNQANKLHKKNTNQDLMEEYQRTAFEKYRFALDKYQMAIDHDPSLKRNAETHMTEIKLLLVQNKKVTDASL